MEAVHLKIKNFYCDHCPLSFYVRKRLENHLKTHFNILDIPCAQCHLFFRSASALAMHQKSVHENCRKPKGPSVPEPCEICGKIFSSRQSCKSHYRAVHLKEKPFVCDFPGCDQSFFRHSDLSGHQSSIHLNKMETCPICLKEVRKLSQHMKSIHEERRFECTFEENGRVCGKKFAFGRELKRHVEISHCGVRKFACQYCDSSFKRKEDWRGHTLNIHEKKKIQCELCPTLLSSKKYYGKHVRSHHRDLDPDTMESVLKKIRDTPEEELFNHQK
jgi:hypothetical protein